jgi:molybdopterin synthase catalytic subunit
MLFNSILITILKALQSIVDKARKHWSIGNITVIHRVGDLVVNEQIVLVITTSKHRKNAFDACEFIMDYLKTIIQITH